MKKHKNIYLSGLLSRYPFIAVLYISMCVSMFALLLTSCGDKEVQNKGNAVVSASSSNELPVYDAKSLEDDKRMLDEKYMQFIDYSSSRVYSYNACITVADEYIDMLQSYLVKYGRGYRIRGDKSDVYYAITNKEEILKTIDTVTKYRDEAVKKLKSEKPKIPLDPVVVKPVVREKPQNDCLPFGKTLYFSCSFEKLHDIPLIGRDVRILACGIVPLATKKQARAQIDASFKQLDQLNYASISKSYSKKIIRWSTVGSMNMYLEKEPVGSTQNIVGDYMFESFIKDSVIAEYRKRYGTSEEKVCMTGFGFRAWIDFKAHSNFKVDNYLYLNNQKEPIGVIF